MRLIVLRNCLRILPESVQDVVYIEEMLKLKKGGDFTIANLVKNRHWIEVVPLNSSPPPEGEKWSIPVSSSDNPGPVTDTKEFDVVGR